MHTYAYPVGLFQLTALLKYKIKTYLCHVTKLCIALKADLQCHLRVLQSLVQAFGTCKIE